MKYKMIKFIESATILLFVTSNFIGCINSSNNWKSKDSYEVTLEENNNVTYKEPEDTMVTYKSFINSKGFEKEKSTSECVSGNTYSKEDFISAVSIEVNKDEDFDVSYSVYINNDKWQNEESSGNACGIQDISDNSIGAIKIELRDKNYNDNRNYDKLNIYYSILDQNDNWSKYYKNGEVAGTDDNLTKVKAIKVYIGEDGNNKTNYLIGTMESINDNIEVKINKYRGYETQYYLAKININNPSVQLKTVDSENGLSKLSDLLKDKNAIIGINGSSFSKEGDSINKVVKDSKEVPLNKSIQYTMAIDKDGKLFLPYERENNEYTYSTEQETKTKYSYTGSELINKWQVKETFHFGPPLIVNSKEYKYTNYKESAPRTIIGQIDSNNYIILVADGRNFNDNLNGLKLKDAIKILRENNAVFAFNLDGGGSTTLYYKGNIINYLSDGEERKVTDGIYFSSY